MPTLAIVAALEREVTPLIKTWRPTDQPYAGRPFRFFETANAVLVCGGIGPGPARRAAEAIIALYSPSMIYSAGFAGAATRSLKAGDILIPRRVVNAQDGSSVDTATGEGTLVTFDAVASPEQKSKLAASFAAQAIDMEAAAVAQAARARGIPFAAIKAISDANDFALPPMENFITPTGEFRTSQFAFFLLSRPWLWPTAIRLARNSAKSARALSSHLHEIIDSQAQSPYPMETR